MAISRVPNHTALSDGQSVQITGPDGIMTGFRYDQQQRALYFKESQIISKSYHGHTHIAEDPVPNATCDTPGLMSEDDKCKLDSLLGTRIGVLGFQGSGFPNDGGWMNGDIILAAGTEFISLERIGNIIRFTVDSPLPINCACESCTQIFWVQDETEISSIRPPSCSGKLPGINGYGELKIFVFPESTTVNPNSPSATLQNKGHYPALIFKRYDDAIVPGAAEFELILQRNSNNSLQTEIGWAFTPGATGKAECIWFMGLDDDGSQISFELEIDEHSGSLGSILYNGNLITKKMGVITGYTNTILTTNLYSVKQWDVNSAEAVGDVFSAKNVWYYVNPENSKSGFNPQQIVLDHTIDLLPIGTLVDLWSFKIGESGGQNILKWYFKQKPSINQLHMWSWVGAQQFGDSLVARKEVEPSDLNTDANSYQTVKQNRNIDRKTWGLTGFEDPLFRYDDELAGTDNDLNKNSRAVIDVDVPALKVTSSETNVDNFSERPVILWNRKNLYNALLRLDIGKPTASNFTPFDVILRAPIDEYDQKYLQIVEIGDINGANYIRVSGASFDEIPPFGAVRILDGANENSVFNYAKKCIVRPSILDTSLANSIVLISDDENIAYQGSVGDVVETLHQEYNSTILRIEFHYDSETEETNMQFKVGVLDMSQTYELNDSDDIDDYIRGLSGGYTVSNFYTQEGDFTGVGTPPDSSADNFVIYDGGIQIGGDQNEYWNRLEVMIRDDQVWVWWNKLLIPPSTSLSANLNTSVDVSTPYFPIIVNQDVQFGKFGCRMWPGATIRRFDLRTQLSGFNEFSYGQLEVI